MSDSINFPSPTFDFGCKEKVGSVQNLFPMKQEHMIQQRTMAEGANAEAPATKRARIADFIMVDSARKVGFRSTTAPSNQQN